MTKEEQDENVELSASADEIRSLRAIAKDAALMFETNEPGEHFAAQDRIIAALIAMEYLKSKPEGML